MPDDEQLSMVIAGLLIVVVCALPVRFPTVARTPNHDGTPPEAQCIS
jgi:hypothetical protein